LGRKTEKNNKISTSCSTTGQKELGFCSGFTDELKIILFPKKNISIAKPYDFKRASQI